MRKVKLLTVNHVLEINRMICAEQKQSSVCFDQGKIESAIGAAFYPGSYPFQYGGIAHVAGALCFFLIKAHAFLDGNKRTAAIAAAVFMDLNGWDILYPLDLDEGINAFSEIIEQCASSMISKKDLMNWFEQHKRAR
jgi:death on curing protein